MDEFVHSHTAARRYCLRGQDEHLPPMLGLFPNLRAAVEQFVPTDFKTVEEVREMFCMAADLVEAEEPQEREEVSAFLVGLRLAGAGGMRGSARACIMTR